MKKQYSIRHALTAVLLGLLLLPGVALAAGQVGDQVSGFTTETYLDGEKGDFSLHKALDQGPVVVYFFPAAYTKGCDIEAHSFSLNHDKFAQAGATVIGISGDPADKLRKFSANPDFAAGSFAIASDPEGKIASQFGLEMDKAKPGMTDINGDAVAHGLLPRVTFVLDQKGRIVKRLSTEEDGVNPNEHAPKALKAIQEMHSHGG